VSIKITETRYDIIEDGNIVKMDILIKGTTNGVNHCKIAFVEYYTNGTHDDIYWEEEFDYPPMSFGENISEINHFKATSSDWKTWEYHIKGQGWIGDDDYFDDNVDDKLVKERKVFVRAFKDAEENNWNQASETQKIKPDDSINENGTKKDDDKESSGFLSGFEAITFICTLTGILVIIALRRRK
jgi:hypothetical protein